MYHTPTAPALLAALVLSSATLPDVHAHSLDTVLSLSPPARTEFRANTFTHSTQDAPALAVAANGSFAVVWASRRQQSGRSTVLYQHFGPMGVAHGDEAPLAVWRDGHLTAPVFAYADDGSAWAAWQSAQQDGDGAAIIARRFTPDGQGQSEVLVNTTTTGDQMAPALAVLTDGRAAVTWTSANAAERPYVAMRLLETSDHQLAEETLIDVGAGYHTTTPSITRGADGRVAVAYTRVDDESGSSQGVWLRILAPTGTWVTPPVRVSEAGAVEPTIAATHDGYVLAWHAVTNADDGYDVYATLVDSKGAPASLPTRVNDEHPGLQNGAAIGVAPSGQIAIAYNHRRAGARQVMVRHFDEQLTPLDAGARLTQGDAGARSLTQAVSTRRLAFAADGTLLAAWHGAVSDREQSGVGITLVHPQHAQRPTPLLSGVTQQMRPYLPHAMTAVDNERAGAQPHVPPVFGERPSQSAVRTTAVSANGLGFTGIVNTGVTPPDPHLAVGPDHLVIIANGEIAFFTKDGTRTFRDGIEGAAGFWGPVEPTDFIFDPEVIYDHSSGRFFAMAAEAFAGGRSFVLIAVSDDMDPNGDWFYYRFETTATSGDLFDSPNIGVTDDAVVITGDGFGRGAVYAVYAYDKASLLNGDPPAIETQFLFPTITQSAGFPRVTTGTGDTLYLVEHKEAFDNNTQVRVIAFANLLSTPTTDFVDVTVPPYGAPEDPPQAGTTSRPDTFDARFWSVDQGVDGTLWATHHINPDRVVARWYELALNGWPASGNTPALAQSGDIDLGPNVRTFFSAINAAEDGSVAITYSRSSPNEFISMGSAYRTPCTAPSTVVESLRHRDTVGGYTLGRWGDYAAVQFDPIDPTLYWAHHEYAENNSWRTWVQSVDTSTSCALVDINRDALVNGVDARVFFRAYNLEQCVGDWNRDGIFSPPDLMSFFSLWSGCRE